MDNQAILNANSLLTVVVKSPTRTEFSGQAKSVTSYNKKGKFDVLAYHANFISIIEQMIIIRPPDKEEIKIAVERGVMKISKDTVTVLIGVHSVK
jgi:F0F1-type ATP synthase epsilon subunit